MQIDSGTGNFVCNECQPGYFTFEGAETATTPKYFCEPCEFEGQEWSTTSFKCDCPTGETLKGTFCVDSSDYNSVTANYNPDTNDAINYR